MRIKQLISMLILCILALPTWAETAHSFISKLQSHYKPTLDIQAYSLHYHFLNKVYREHHYWDYKMPNRHWSRRAIEVDMNKRHFYDNDTLYFTGGRIYDRVQYQNDSESYFYEKSASSLGKAVIRRAQTNFDGFIRHQVMNIDFLAIRPLLNETDIDGNITFKTNEDEETITVQHSVDNDNVVEYVFDHASLQLTSIDKGVSGGKFIYSDYQTTNGLTYARSVHKYYDGATEPNYISYNDRFDVIEGIAPDKLQLPAGYGPEIKRGDGILVAQEIARDVYLITDSSAYYNALVQVADNRIRIFGAAVSPSFAEKTLKLIEQQFPDKTVASIYVTHPHGHQISGLNVFASRGVEVFADHYSIDAIKAYPRFADSIAQFKFRAITHGEKIDGVHYYVLENLHSKRQGFVHFADQKLIFQSQFLHIPFDNTIAKIVPSYSRSFIDFIRNQNLNFNRVVGNHKNNNITADVVNKTYDAMM